MALVVMLRDGIECVDSWGGGSLKKWVRGYELKDRSLDCVIFSWNSVSSYPFKPQSLDTCAVKPLPISAHVIDHALCAIIAILKYYNTD